VDVAEVSLQVQPGQIRSTTFNLSNIGTAPLSFNITATGPGANASVANNSASRAASISGLSSGDFPKPPKLDLYAATNARNAMPLQRANATARKRVSPLLHKPSSDDALVLDDGDRDADDFVGYGPGSDKGFMWVNFFPLQNFGFKLKSFDVYMRSEFALSNVVYLAILDANGQKMMEANVDMGTSILGDWNTIVLNNPATFSAGSGFQILVQASNEIEYPAGTDVDAQAPDLSFYFDPGQNKFVNLNTVPGFEQGAFLIRANGEKIIGGGNQPPVAKGTISKLEAKVNESITFDASDSFDPDGQITQYLWNFGDGGTSAQKIATHAYAQAGIYALTLTVTDNQGATGQATGQITVTSGTANRLTVNPTSGTVAAAGSQAITVTFDAQGLAEGNYQGQLAITSNGGNRTLPVRIFVSNTVGVDDDASELPKTFTLAQNYPNPFSTEGRSRFAGNPETSIRYALPFESEVTLSIYDLSGRLVAQLQNGTQQAGEHGAPWNGRD
jgi:PKD repeat protein